MTVTLTNEKKEKIKDFVLGIKNTCICKISLRQLAKIIRNKAANFVLSYLDLYITGT